jgi:hypothetical protein
MISTLIALALTGASAALPNTSTARLADCQMQIEKALAPAGASLDSKAQKPGLGREWRPAGHPEAGFYYTLNKQVNGCRVPMPVGGPPHNFTTPPLAGK